MIPDVEAIVGDHLRTTTGARVSGRRFGSSAAPWVLVTQLDVQDVGHNHEYFTDHMLQLDCYAGDTATEAEEGTATATDLARNCREVLHEMVQEDLAVTVASVVFTNMARIPDTNMEPAQERVVLTAEIRVHP